SLGNLRKKKYYQNFEVDSPTVSVPLMTDSSPGRLLGDPHTGRLSVCRLSKQSLINSSRDHLDESTDERKERGDGTLDRLRPRQYGGAGPRAAARGVAERGVQRCPHFLRYRVGSANGTPRLGGLCPRLRTGRHVGSLASRPPGAVD